MNKLNALIKVAGSIFSVFPKITKGVNDVNNIKNLTSEAIKNHPFTLKVKKEISKYSPEIQKRFESILYKRHPEIRNSVININNKMNNI